MATQYWRGTGGTIAGDFDDAGNWNSAKPGAGDTGVIDSSAAQAPTTNLDALDGVTLAKFIVRNPAVSAGSASAHLEIDADEIIIDMGSTGKSLYLFSINATPEINIEQGAQGGGIVQLSGNIDISSGAQAGSVDLVQDPNFGTNAVATTVASGARINGASITATSDVTWNGGLISSGSLSSAANLGSWTGTGGSITTTGTATLTIENLGSALTHQSTGTIASATIRSGGTFTDIGQAYTITTLDMDGAAVVTLGTGVTITNPVSLLTDGRGPTLQRGSTLTITGPGA